MILLPGAEAFADYLLSILVIVPPVFRVLRVSGRVWTSKGAIDVTVEVADIKGY